MCKIKATLFNNLAMCHFKREEIRESKYYNDRCLELDNNYEKAQYRKIQIYMKQGKMTKALEYCKECIAKYNSKNFKDLMQEIVMKI